jgi:hypothetical protein
MWPDRHQWSGRSADSHRLFQFLGRPECDLLARLDLAVAPVAGFRPILAARFRTWSIPRPVRRNLAPFFRWRVVSVTKSPSTASACFFAMSWLSANSAARCLSVTVGCAAAFAGAAFFGGFLGRGGSFLGWRHDDLLRHNDERPVRMPKSVGFAQMYRAGPSGRQAAANPAVVSVSISSWMISQPCEAA